MIPYTTTPGHARNRLERAALRALLRSGCSMNDADRKVRLGLITPTVHARFARLFAWGTATEHPLTRHVPLPRWIARRERVRRAVSTLVGQPVGATKPSAGKD